MEWLLLFIIEKYIMRIVSILMLLIANTLSAQDIISITSHNISRGVIHKKDKTTIEGKITTPISAYQKKIRVRTAGKTERIKSTEIDSIVYDENSTDILVFTSTEYYRKNKSADKKVRRPQWLRRTVNGKIKLYETTYINHKREHTESSSYYFIQRENEKYPTLIGVQFREPFPVSNGRSFRINLEKYFANDPDFLKLIEEKEYSMQELVLICRAYNNK